jgi:hypothetical protein
MAHCKIVGCFGTMVAKGFCDRHYRRQRLYGDPFAGQTGYDEIPNFFARILASSPTDECILWPFALSPNGYGATSPERYGTKYAHIYVCEKVHGPKPTPGSLACHAPVICNQKACVNPAHLRWATRRENALDTVLDGTNWWGNGYQQKGARGRGA